MDVFITFDMERHSFETNTPEQGVIRRIREEAIPGILELLKKYHIKATFFSTAIFARDSQKILQKLRDSGHEIGCHGFDHTDYYDVLPLHEQLAIQKNSKRIIEEASETEIVSFRAPALRINTDTIIALENNNFKFDSSVASQRFDGPFTSGAIQKLKWITAHRTPYRMSYSSPFRSGTFSITEVPVSSFGWPFIGTHLRISPFLTFLTMRMLILESFYNNKPLVFLIHPQELMTFNKGKNLRKTNIFSGVLRHRLKRKNLGEPCCKLFEKLLNICSQKNAVFKTIKEIEI